MFSSVIRKLADNTAVDSFSHSQRKKRFAFFSSKLALLPRPLTILDIGGTVEFWRAMDFKDPDVHITLLNLHLPNEKLEAPFNALIGDATDLRFIKDQQYDIVFSNSVIEHLYTWENQRKMANEVLRVGKYHFIQTPNYWFPIEPHWVFPFFQFLPKKTRYWLTAHFSFGHIAKTKNKEKAIAQVDEVVLLSKKELTRLFPQSSIFAEQFIGLNKSFIAHNFS